jgi:uncharacterized metal-binding protein
MVSLIIILALILLLKQIFAIEEYIETSFWTLFIAFALSYTFSNFYLSPDLDLARSSPKNNWGPLKFIWIPYSKIFKHRGISHSIIFGTLTRIIYLLLIIIILITLIDKLTALEIPYSLLDLRNYSLDLIITVFIGLYIPNILHTIADKLIKN